MEKLERGNRIGKYEIIRRLTVGGMAEIFLARVAGPGGFRKFLTVKRILPNLAEEEGFVEMFLEEARISAGLSHSNIAQVFDLGDEQGSLFIAMEFIPGEDLSRLRKTVAKLNLRLPVGFSAKVIREVCLALHYAHHFTDPAGAPMPIIHRDVSPKNVMVTYSGSVKVIDFGIAKAKGSTGSTRAGMVKGSSGYMSPEQIRGVSLDGRSDLFSAGVLLHEMLTGKRLFLGGNEAEAMGQILHAEIRPPNQIAADVPAALSEVAMRATSRDVAARFATGKQMARAIEAAAGALLFDEEQLSAQMHEIFPEGAANMRDLLQLSAPHGDSARLNAVVDGLAAEVTPSGQSKRHPTDEGPTRSTVPTARTTTAAATVKVLAVDDSSTGLALLEAYLRPEGFRVLTATSGPLALELLEREAPDLIVLDVMMPEMNGFELCARIRKLKSLKYVPILFVSAACSLEERLQGLNAGGDDFIRKPYEPTELIARIRMHLQRVAMIAGHG